MQETLQQYRDRTGFMWDSLAQSGGFRTGGGLALKVDPEGRFRPFCGDTVIFALPPPMLRWLEDIQNQLYEACGDCLAQRIPPQTFHITLHDLLSQPQQMPEGIDRGRPQALQAIREVREWYPHAAAIRSNCLFSMVGTSVVMGFEPTAEDDCAALTAMYERFQQLVPLTYPLTLHATLAYYRPGEYDDATLLRLRDAMQRIGRERTEWRLDVQQLFYAVFDSMAQYRSFCDGERCAWSSL